MMTSKKATEGFTLMEVLFVVALLGILVSSAIYFTDIAEKKSDIEYVAINKWTHADMASAIISAYARNGNTLSSVTKAKLVETGSVETSAPSGLTSWSLKSASNDDLSIYLVAPNATVATDIVARLKEKGMIDSVKRTGVTITVSYTL